MEKLLSILIALVSLSVHAEAIQTNYTLTPAAGQLDFRLHGSLGTGKNNFPPPKSDVNFKSRQFNGAVLYGLTDRLALGIAAGRKSSEFNGSDYTLTQKGALPFSMQLRSNIDFDGATLYSGIALNFEVERAINNYDKGDYTFSDGRSDAQFDLGLIGKFNTLKLGALLGYVKAFDGQTEEISSGVTTKYDVSKGDTFVIGLLAELDHKLHPSVGLKRTTSYQTRLLSHSSSTPDYSIGRKHTEINFTSRLDLADFIQVLPSFSVTIFDKKDDGSQFSAADIGITARFIF